MKYSFGAGVFNKTGSHWIRSIVTRMAEQTNREFVIVSTSVGGKVVNGPAIYYDHHSAFAHPLFVKKIPTFCVVRHPKDMLISATRFHDTTCEEEWIAKARRRGDRGHRWDFGGKTYKEMLNALPLWEQKLAFEMQHGGTIHVNLMKDNSKRHFNVRYEDLMDEYPYPKIFDSLFDHLRLDDEDRELFIYHYQDTHTKGGGNLMEDIKDKVILNSNTNQYKDLWPDELNSLYNQLYPNIERELGYE